MTDARATLNAEELLANYRADARLTIIGMETLRSTESVANEPAYVTQAALEGLINGDSSANVTLAANELLIASGTAAFCSLVTQELLLSNQQVRSNYSWACLIPIYSN